MKVLVDKARDDVKAFREERDDEAQEQLDDYDVVYRTDNLYDVQKRELADQLYLLDLKTLERIFEDHKQDIR